MVAAVRELPVAPSRLSAAAGPHNDAAHVLPARDAYRLELAARGAIYGGRADETIVEAHEVEHGWPREDPIVDAFLRFGYGDGDGAIFANDVAVAIERYGLACRTDWAGAHNYMIFALEREQEFGVWEPAVQFDGEVLPVF